MVCNSELHGAVYGVVCEPESHCVQVHSAKGYTVRAYSRAVRVIE